MTPSAPAFHGTMGELAKSHDDARTVAGEKPTCPRKSRARQPPFLCVRVFALPRYAFETGVARPTPKFTVNTWHYHTQWEATARGFATIASNDSHFYLVYDQPYSSYWVDIASGMNASQRALLRGGSVSAWGDEFCYVAYCIHPDKKPAAHALFPPSADGLFHQSVLGLSFPRAAVGAGSFWNYVSSLDAAYVLPRLGLCLAAVMPVMPVLAPTPLSQRLIGTAHHAGLAVGRGG